MPDFGYGEDNYIIHNMVDESRNKWSVLTELLSNSEKFSWLMNFVKLKGLEKKTNQA